MNHARIAKRARMIMTKRSKAEEITADRARVSKHPTSFKLTETALDILSALAAKRGVAKSALMENLLRAAWLAEIEHEKARTIKS